MLLDKRAAVAPTAASAVAVATALPPAATEAAVAANNLGAHCCNKSEFYEAIQHFSSAIGLDCTNHIYYHNRGHAYREIKVWTCAIADARKVSMTST